MSAPQLSVVIPTFNRAGFLRRVLEAYEHQVGVESFELVLVDDASRDATPALLSTWQPKRYAMTVRVLPKNGGPAHARNVGIGLVRAPFVLITGDDILPHPEFLAGHVAFHQARRDPRLALLGLTLWPHDLPLTTVMQHIDGVGAQQFGYHYLKDGQSVDFRHFYTSNISLSRELLESDGKLFDAGFPLAAYEDVELGYRLAQRGMRIEYSTRPRGYHYHPHTVWSFSQRQRGAGRMAKILADKQPAVRHHLGFRELAYFKWCQTTPASRANRRMLFAEGRTLAACEEALLTLCSAFEFTPSPALDSLYLATFQYFYLKGLCEATMEGAIAQTLQQTLFSELTPNPIHSLLVAHPESGTTQGQRLFFERAFRGRLPNHVMDVARRVIGRAKRVRAEVQQWIGADV